MKRKMYNGNIAEKILATLYGFRHFYSVAYMMFWKGMVEFLKILGTHEKDNYSGTTAVHRRRIFDKRFEKRKAYANHWKSKTRCFQPSECNRLSDLFLENDRKRLLLLQAAYFKN